MLVRNISDQLDRLHWFILSKHKEAVSEISNIFIASPRPHMSSLFEATMRVENVKKFSNLNIFLSIFPFAPLKIVGNCWNEALAKNPRWTQKRYDEPSLEIKLLFSFLSFSLDGVGMFIYVCMGAS